MNKYNLTREVLDEIDFKEGILIEFTFVDC